MSFQAMAWASEQTTGSCTRKAVLYALANHANKNGECYLRVETICDEAEIGDTAARAALKYLADNLGVTRERTRRADGTLSVYRFTLPLPSRDGNPPSPDDASPPSPGDGQEPGSSLEPKELTPHSPPKLVKVDGKKVSQDEAVLAAEVIDAFNDVFSTRFTVAAWLGKVVMRLREHPDLTVAEHRAVIARSFAAPWWTDVPSPAVVYGNAPLFERALSAVGTPVNGNGRPNTRYGQRDVSPEEIRALGERLRAERLESERKALASG
jgi:Helix-turn-helix domain